MHSGYSKCSSAIVCKKSRLSSVDIFSDVCTFVIPRVLRENLPRIKEVLTYLEMEVHLEESNFADIFEN